MTYDELIAAYKQAEADKAYTPIFEERQMEGGEGGGGGTSSFYVGDDTSSYTTPQGLFYRDPATGITTLRRPAGFSGRDLEVLSADPSGKVTTEYLEGGKPAHQNFLKFLGGVGAAAFGLPALGEALGAAGAAVPAATGGGFGEGITAATLGELGMNTGVAGLPTGASVLPTGAIVNAAGEVLGTLPSTFGSVVPGAAAAAGAGAAGAGAAGSALTSALTNPKLLTSLAAGLASGIATDRGNKASGGGGLASLPASGLKAVPEYTFERTALPVDKARKPGVSPEQMYFSDKFTKKEEKKLASGGITSLKPHEYAAGGRYLSGPGDGMSDNIKANIEGRQEARLADGEFVIPADVVSHIGNGSSNAGAKRLHQMMARIRKARTGNPKQGKKIRSDKYLPA